MDRRRGNSSRPASSEEVECWTQAAALLNALSSKFSNPTTLETFGRVNRLISAWPPNDTLPAEGLDGVKTIHKKLHNGLDDIKATAEDEERAIDEALERVGVLIALRKAPESPPPEKRNKRPRAPSPSAPAISATSGHVPNRVSITLPARTSVPPGAAPTREAKRRQTLTKQLPLREGRKVAFHAPGKSDGGGDPADSAWILAIVIKCNDKHSYDVQDAEPAEDGQPGIIYPGTTLESIIPLPDPTATIGTPAHVGAYTDFPAGSTVMALYPDTSCFYRAEVIATPKEMQPTGRTAPSSKFMPTYKLKFEDDDNQEHSVAAQWVVEWPRGP